MLRSPVVLLMKALLSSKALVLPVAISAGTHSSLSIMQNVGYITLNLWRSFV